MELELRTGDAVIALMNDQHFMRTWQALYAQCPWGTGYQSPCYVGAWYRLYDARYKPLVLWTEVNGALTGLLALALDAGSNTIVGAGGPQAVYQVWLATPQSSDAFIQAVIERLRRDYPRRYLHLKHLAPGAPLAHLRGQGGAVRCRLSEPEPRPYMRTDSERIVKSFNGKTNRNLYNRLKRLGEVTFSTVTEPTELEEALDEYIRQYDFRQAAMYDCAPFRVDPAKKAFYRRLLDAGILHVSVLKAGDAIVSVNVGLRGGDSVQIGITHSPLYANYSPGRLHIYMLCMALAKEGYDYFDLTPGGGYKSQLATATDEVVELSTFGALQGIQLQQRAQMVKLASAWLSRFGVNTTKARLMLARVRKAVRLALSGELPLPAADKYCIYQAVSRVGEETGLPPMLRANRIDDLLHYDEKDGRKTYHEFQFEAMKRLESQQHVYTITDGGRLVFCAWVGMRSEPEAAQKNEKKPVESNNTIALYDIYRHACAVHEVQLRSVLEQILTDLHGRFNPATVELVLHAHDHAARNVAEEGGFRLVAAPCSRVAATMPMAAAVGLSGVRP